MVGVKKASSLSTSWGTHSLRAFRTVFNRGDWGISVFYWCISKIQIYIFLKIPRTGWRKISQAAPTKHSSCWWYLAWSVVSEIFPTACATEGCKFQVFSSQLYFPVHFLMYFCGRIHNGTQGTGRLKRHLLYPTSLCPTSNFGKKDWSISDNT